MHDTLATFRAAQESEWASFHSDLDGTLQETDLAQFAAALERAPTPELLQQLIATVEEERCNLSEASWRSHTLRLRASPLGALLTQDPITNHALRKPRGYAGDAGLLDRIYFGQRDDYQHGRPVTALGRMVNSVIVAAPCAEAVRQRRVLLAQALDDEARRCPGLRAASIACGYAREANFSRAFLNRDIARLTCFDQDSESTRQIAFCHDGNPTVVPVCASIKRLIDGSLELGEHDFIYSAGLFDYLDARVATALTARLFAALAPGGRLLIGNFAKGTPQRAYMEAFADWWLIYRGRSEVGDFLDDVSASEIERVSIDTCVTGCVHYLDVRKQR